MLVPYFYLHLTPEYEHNLQKMTTIQESLANELTLLQNLRENQSMYKYWSELDAEKIGPSPATIFTEIANFYAVMEMK